MTAGGGRAPRVSPSHGHGGSERGGHRHADGCHGSRGGIAPGHGNTRRFAGADPAALARPLCLENRAPARQGCPRPSVCEAREDRELELPCAPCSRACSPFPATVVSTLTGVFHELRDYSGWVILEAEQDPRVADPMAYASLGFWEPAASSGGAHAMTGSLLVKPDLSPAAAQVHRITPESAGWRYVGVRGFRSASPAEARGARCPIGSSVSFCSPGAPRSASMVRTSARSAGGVVRSTASRMQSMYPARSQLSVEAGKQLRARAVLGRRVKAGSRHG